MKDSCRYEFSILKLSYKSIAFPLTTEHIQETMDAMGITNGRFTFDELSAALDYYSL